MLENRKTYVKKFKPSGLKMIVERDRPDERESKL
jgi:hypothetical protein